MGDEGPVIFIDGVCVMCNWLVQFALERDRRAALRFATLQGAYAHAKLPKHGVEPDQLQTFYLLLEPGSSQERVLERSAAALHVLHELGGFWRLLSTIGKQLPVSLCDALYGWLARNRYRLFGQREQCLVPRPEWRDRFLDGL